MVGNGVYDGSGYVLILCLCRVLCDLVYFIVGLLLNLFVFVGFRCERFRVFFVIL